MKILSKELTEHYQTTSLQRGHCVFTSMRAHQDNILFLDAHLDRLLSGAMFLFPNAKWDRALLELKNYVSQTFLQRLPEFQEKCSIRITLFDESIYLQLRTLPDSAESIKLTSALKIRTPGILPPYLKLPNYVEVDQEVIRAKLANFDDVVFFDDQQKATEASTSNLFMVATDGSILTPLPSSMVLEGIVRKKLIQKLKGLGFSVFEKSFTKTDLLNAREIWLTNSIRGIRFIDQFEEKSFIKKNSLFEKTVIQFGRYGEFGE